MHSIVVITESITSTLAAESPLPDPSQPEGGEDNQKRSEVKMKCQIFDSLSKIACFVSDHTSNLIGSYTAGRSISLEDVFLSSRLLAVLLAASSARVRVLRAVAPEGEAVTTGEGDGGRDGSGSSGGNVEVQEDILYYHLDPIIRTR